MKKIFLSTSFLAAIFLFNISCQKKVEAPQNQVTLEVSVEDLFTKAVDQLQSQGHSIEDLDKTHHLAKSDWKTIELDDLVALAALKQGRERYQQGRIAYKVSVSGDESRSTLMVDANIEGLYIPTQKESQGNERFGSVKNYQSETSNGTAEKNFIAAIQQ